MGPDHNWCSACGRDDLNSPPTSELKRIGLAPQDATEILALTVDRYGNRRWLVIHCARGGGDDVPPFHGWFYWTGRDYIEIRPEHVIGWLPLPVTYKTELGVG